MGYSISCDMDPLDLPDLSCGKWKCDLYNCSVNEGPYEPKCMCFCRYGLVACFFAFFVYSSFFILSWKIKMLLPRLVSTLGFSIAGFLLCLALFTGKCETAVICSFISLAVFPCCVAGLCGLARVQESRRDDGLFPREVSYVDEPTSTSPKNSFEDTDSPPALALGPNGELQLAVPIKTDESTSEAHQQRRHRSNEYEY